MSDQPAIVARIAFLPPDEGGRLRLPTFRCEPWYSPHIVIQDENVRAAIIDSDGRGREEYLGVQFIDGPVKYAHGEPAEFVLELLYHPRVSYESVVEGATFTVREGGRIVGSGRVLSRAK